MKLIVISSKQQFGDPILLHELEKRGAIFYEHFGIDLNNIPELFDNDDKVLAIDEVNTLGGFKSLNEILPKMKNVKYITNLSARYHEFDLNTANKLGITYSNNPDTTSESVAELAIMDLLALVRNLPLIYKPTFEFYGDKHLGREVKELTVGILGYGNIGRRIASMCMGLGMSVKIWSKNKKVSPFPQVELEELIRQDVIFISLPTNNQTKAFFTENFFNSFKANQYIIDTTASDELYDKNLPIQQVNDHKLAGYAFEAENSKSKYIQGTGNVLITPHVGWGTKDSYKRLYENWTKITIAAYENTPINVVTE